MLATNIYLQHFARTLHCYLHEVPLKLMKQDGYISPVSSIEIIVNASYI